MNQKKMFWTYTILAGLCSIGAIIFGVLATLADKKENPSPLPITNTTFNIKGDYINGNKKVNKETTKDDTKQNISDKHIPPEVVKQSNDLNTPYINYGIVNQAPNYGNQTINNYSNEKEAPRKLNDKDINDIRSIFPLDYQITFIYEVSSEESKNYAEEMYQAMKEMGYHIIADPVNIIQESEIHVEKGDRYFFFIFKDKKRANIIIKQQK